MMRPTDPRSAARLKSSPEWWVAVCLSILLVAIHLFYLTHIGGLWQDEVTSVNHAQGNFSQIAQDSFPILMPLLLRGWSVAGLGGSELPLRVFGVLMGLLLTGVFWLAARWLRQAPPIWSLVFVALNSWVIYYSDSLRPYGLGSALIALCMATAWNFLQRPALKTWLYFAGATVLSVQTLYQNSVLVAAICAGAWLICWRRKSIRLATAVLLAGLAGAVSLLLYWNIFVEMPAAAAPLRQDFAWPSVLTNLNTVLAFPLTEFFWIWVALALVLVLRGFTNVCTTGKDDLVVYGAAVFLSGAVAFFAFLWLAKFPVQPWYFLPLLALAAVCLEAGLPRFDGRYRSLLWGGLLATALISSVFALRVLDCRFTNIDVLAKRLNGLSQKNDFVIVTPWQGGITFGRYFKGACPWATVPPIEDHTGHRYDLIKLQMENTNAMAPVLERAGQALRSGGTVWVVGGVGETNDKAEPVSLPLPPLPHTGWHESPYAITWNNQMTWFLRRHSRAIECLDPATNEPVSSMESLKLYKITGWQEPP